MIKTKLYTGSTMTLLVAMIMILASCGSGKNKPGRIFMPDMTYSTAQEAYAPYGDVSGDSISALLPVAGTIPRGFQPYHLPNNLEGYVASAELVNPVENNEKNLIEGGRLYQIYCSPCHGDGGGGDGLVATTAATFGLQPAGYWDGTMIGLTDGQMFHSIHYGKNLMGSYASQLSKEQRWMVIHFINKLQDDNAPTEEPAETPTGEPTDGVENPAEELVPDVDGVNG